MSNELVINTRPKGTVAEAIRTLRTNLQFTFVDDDIKTIMVTSSIPGEGKSFVSANLACSFSLINCKTLLIDCDLRKGRQNKIFNLPNNKGLSNLLLDDIDNYKEYINETRVPNLDILLSGIVPPNPSELLGSDKNKELLEKLKKDYDLIILDCPPVNGITDSLILTKLADEAVLVSAYKKTPMDLLMQSKKSLENSGAKIAGVIVNKMERKSNNHYYSKYYQ